MNLAAQLGQRLGRLQHRLRCQPPHHEQHIGRLAGQQLKQCTGQGLTRAAAPDQRRQLHRAKCVHARGAEHVAQ